MTDARAALIAQHERWQERAAAERRAGTIIVCGGRDYADYERVAAALQKVAHRLKATMVIRHGAAPGADTLADRWAESKGYFREPYPADWERYGKAAGPLRNQAMVDAGAVGAVAFPGGAGTADCARRCAAAGIKVWCPYG